jgi:hypothetical protein
MLKKILCVAIFLVVIGSIGVQAQADDATYTNRDSVGFVGKYDFKDQQKDNQDKNNGLTSSENRQIGNTIPNAGDSNSLPYLVFSALGGLLIILSTRSMIKDDNHHHNVRKNKLERI